MEPHAATQPFGIQELPAPEGAAARHTLILSDLHLTEVYRPDPGRPFWHRWKQPDFMPDEAVRDLLRRVAAEAQEPVELIYAGDAFDFDTVLALPDEPPFPVSWLERRRGLNAEQEKSHFKIRRIVADHPVWVAAMRDWLAAGHRVVFIMGNHDLELAWPAVQKQIVRAVAPGKRHGERVRFCEWFYLSNRDTLVEHGNQYDAYCVTQNPARPFIWKGGRLRVRIPFGNQSTRLMINGMGYFNPHVEASFILPFRQYLANFFRYMLRGQPLLMVTWFWSSLVTALVAIHEALLPAVEDPLDVESTTERIARCANARPGQVYALRALRVHPAAFSPLKLLRELWLDRALVVVGLAVFLLFYLGGVLNALFGVSVWWGALPSLAAIPAFLYSTRRVGSMVKQSKIPRAKTLQTSATIAGARRIVHGHTHEAAHRFIKDVEYFNSGFWSAPCAVPDCSRAEPNRQFVWIRPSTDGPREAVLAQWVGGTEGYRRL